MATKPEWQMDSGDLAKLDRLHDAMTQHGFKYSSSSGARGRITHTYKNGTEKGTIEEVKNGVHAGRIPLEALKRGPAKDSTEPIEPIGKDVTCRACGNPLTAVGPASGLCTACAADRGEEIQPIPFKAKDGLKMIAEAGWGCKGGSAGQDFKRLSKDTPCEVVNSKGRVGGEVYVKFDDNPYNWSIPVRALREQGKDAVAPIAIAKDIAAKLWEVRKCKNCGARIIYGGDARGWVHQYPADQEACLIARAEDAVAPIPVGRAKDIANDPRTQLDSRRAELREARRKIAEYSGKPGVTARFDRQINELTREVEKLEKKVAALPPDKPLSERIKGNDVLRDFARKVLAKDATRSPTIKASVNQDNKLDDLRAKIDEAKANGDKAKLAKLKETFKVEYKKQSEMMKRQHAYDELRQLAKRA